MQNLTQRGWCKNNKIGQVGHGLGPNFGQRQHKNLRICAGSNCRFCWGLRGQKQRGQCAIPSSCQYRPISSELEELQNSGGITERAMCYSFILPAQTPSPSELEELQNSELFSHSLRFSLPICKGLLISWEATGTELELDLHIIFVSQVGLCNAILAHLPWHPAKVSLAH